MPRVLSGIGLVALLSAAGFGETGEVPVAFDAADVHVSPVYSNQYMRDGVLRAGRYSIRNATMVQLITAAYGVENDKVLAGPTWLDMSRFDIIAKAPSNTTPEELKLMLQTLLADRFALNLISLEQHLSFEMTEPGKSVFTGGQAFWIAFRPYPNSKLALYCTPRS